MWTSNLPLGSRVGSFIISTQAFNFNFKESCPPSKYENKVFCLINYFWSWTKGDEGYQDVNYSLVGRSLVHSRTVWDAHKTVLICYDLYPVCLISFVHVCLASYSKPLRLRSSTVSLQWRPGQFQLFFKVYCKETKNKTLACKCEYFTNQCSLHSFIRLFSGPPPSENAKEVCSERFPL